MVGPCWAALVTLVLLRSAGNSLAEVDENELAGIVTEFLNEYTPSYKGSNNKVRVPMFSVAATIPCNTDRRAYDMSLVTRSDSSDDVKGKILQCDVYTGSRVVAATVLRWPNVLDQCPDGPVQWNHVLRACRKRAMTWADVSRECPQAVRDGLADHAEYRVLQNFNNLRNNINEDDLLLFYVLSSPCGQRCTAETNQWSILKNINQIMNWKNYAVVFSNVFQPRAGPVISEPDLRDALQRLGTHNGPKGQIGLRKIFRCNIWKGKMVCNRCLDGNVVSPYCYSNNVEPSVSQPQPGRSSSPSHCGQAGSSNNSPQTGLSANVNSNTGGGQGEGGNRRRRQRRGRGKNVQNVDTGDASLQQSGLENRDTNTDAGGDLGDGRRRSNSVSSGAGVPVNDDGNTGGGGGGGGNRRRRRRHGRGKNRQNVDTGDASLQQSSPGIRDTNADAGGNLRDGRRRSNSVSAGAGVPVNDDGNTGGGGGGGGGLSGSGKARKVGGRRVRQKRKGGGNKQASNQGQKKKKKKMQSSQKTGWGSDMQSRAAEKSERRRMSRREEQRGGQGRIHQPLRRV